jgi:hypothetical protein
LEPDEEAELALPKRAFQALSSSGASTTIDLCLGDQPVNFLIFLQGKGKRKPNKRESE